MGSLFGGGSTKVEKTPTRSDSEVQSAALAARKRLLAARGRASTIRTGGLGVTGSAPVAVKRLLGG